MPSLRPLLAALVTLLFLAYPVAAQITSPLGGGSSSEAPAESSGGEGSGGEGPAAEVVESVDLLIELLRDPAVAAELAQRLSGAAEEGAPEAAAPEEPAQPEAASVARRIADLTSGAAESAFEGLNRAWIGLERLPRTLERSLSAFDRDVLIAAAQSLLLVIVVTYAVFMVLKAGGRWIDRRLGREAENRSVLERVALAVTSSILEVVVVALSWAAGYVVSLFAAGGGDIALQSLYLNAFLIVELSKVVVRALLAPRVSNLRLVRLPDRGARSISRWLALSIGLLTYGQLLAVPIVNRNASFLAGSALGTVINIIVVLMAITVVLRHRRSITSWLLSEPEEGKKKRGAMRTLVRLWPVPVLLYLVSLLVIVATRPGGILFPLLQDTGRIIGAGLAGWIVVSLLSGAIARGVRLPQKTRERFPLLERRLNSFVPKFLMVIRFLVIAAVISVTLDVTGVANIGGWLTSERGLAMTGAVASATVILLIAFGIWLVFSSWVEYRLNPDYGRPPTARETTLLTLLRNAATIALLVITLMIVLSELGLDIGPLLASAGVLGLAIGFGAQKMVQDIITGVFIQFENAINVGDVISVGGVTGVVEKLTVRSVSLRDLHGVFHIIPFSSVDLVSNYMREFSFYVCDMGIAYREDVEEAKVAMHDAFAELKKGESGRDVLGELEWFGLNSFGDSAVVLRARIKTLPGKQWATGREYNALLKRIFDERGIEIPFPHQTIYWGEDKEGKAPPLRMIREEVKAAVPAPSPERTDSPVERDPYKSMPDEAPETEDAPR
ncbi:mechanosensitive ion channel domain-containing protein [Pontivivens ytuae]|uniref:Mechanosensitive ion channel n=1 Tax=Pontivivens ytuae TaxID=2789856 RepID=A0A7S9QDN8_9RHOB|nr:mechanosensitive ion channel domain-containing protein [Pontivivens ytuae]QPH55473.1 mechanosensitive ion channel [Pontivivens ytuae]